MIDTSQFALPKPGANKTVLTPAQLRKKKREKWDKGERTCHICTFVIVTFEDAELDHVIPEPAGCAKNSADDNLKMSHWWCNREKGSKRGPSKGL